MRRRYPPLPPSLSTVTSQIIARCLLANERPHTPGQAGPAVALMPATSSLPEPAPFMLSSAMNLPGAGVPISARHLASRWSRSVGTSASIADPTSRPTWASSAQGSRPVSMLCWAIKSARLLLSCSNVSAAKAPNSTAGMMHVFCFLGSHHGHNDGRSGTWMSASIEAWSRIRRTSVLVVAGSLSQSSSGHWVRSSSTALASRRRIARSSCSRYATGVVLGSHPSARTRPRHTVRR